MKAVSTYEQNVLFAFPGQGSQYPGMGSDLHKEYAIARNIYETAGDVLGYDVAELSFKDPENKLNLTQFTQPALLTHSIACLEVFRDLTEDRLKPVMAAGHSLGEYSALVAAKALSFQSALKLVQKRGELMGTHGEGEMTAFPLDIDTIRPIAERFHCAIAGCNLPQQTVIGGQQRRPGPGGTGGSGTIPAKAPGTSENRRCFPYLLHGQGCATLSVCAGNSGV